MVASGSAWDVLIAELDCWAAGEGEATFWWRDDDAVEDTPELRRLLQCAGTIPLGLAVIPSRVQSSLAECLARERTVDVLQHGWAHVNHGPDGNDEYPGSRPRAEVEHELGEGRAILEALFGSQALGVFVPPWHGFDAGFLSLLRSAGLTGFSRKGPRPSRFAAPGVVQANAHVSPIRWSDPPLFGDDTTYLEAIVEHLRGRRLGRYDRAEATGLLTHHLVQNEASYAFITRFAAIVCDHPRAAWVAARDIFGP